MADEDILRCRLNIYPTFQVGNLFIYSELHKLLEIMTVHDSGGVAARLSESFQQTDDKDTRGRRVFYRVKNISYFLDHVEAVRMCTASVSSQTYRSVFQG